MQQRFWKKCAWGNQPWFPLKTLPSPTAAENHERYSPLPPLLRGGGFCRRQKTERFSYMNRNAHLPVKGNAHFSSTEQKSSSAPWGGRLLPPLVGKHRQSNWCATAGPRPCPTFAPTNTFTPVGAVARPKLSGKNLGRPHATHMGPRRSEIFTAAKFSPLCGNLQKACHTDRAFSVGWMMDIYRSSS